MKSKLVAPMLLVGASAFAESRFSISIGGYAPGYYAPPPEYYAPARPHVLYRSRSFDRGWRGAGYWGESPQRQHERAERYGLRRHQDQERFIHGDNPEFWEHQAQEHRELRHEQWHERNEHYGAEYGPAHGSARAGFYRDNY